MHCEVMARLCMNWRQTVMKIERGLKGPEGSLIISPFSCNAGSLLFLADSGAVQRRRRVAPTEGAKGVTAGIYKQPRTKNASYRAGSADKHRKLLQNVIIRVITQMREKK